MKSIWDGGVWTRKRGAEKEMRRTRGKERWRVHLIYVSCVRDNRKVKGYSWGAEGRWQDKTKRKGQSEKLVKEKSSERMGFTVCHFEGNEVCSWTPAIRTLSLLGTILLSV